MSPITGEGIDHSQVVDTPAVRTPWVITSLNPRVTPVVCAFPVGLIPHDQDSLTVDNFAKFNSKQLTKEEVAFVVEMRTLMFNLAPFHM